MKLRINPWLTDGAVRFLNNVFKWFPLLLDHGGRLRILEWGAGNSTLWFLQKGCRVLSVESDPQFVADIEAIAGTLGFKISVASNAEAALRDFDRYDCVVVCAKKFAEGGPSLFADLRWDFIVNDGIDRLSVLEAIESYRGNPVVLLDNAEYCANWGTLARCSAHPDRVRAYRAFLRNKDWRHILFEQGEGRDGHALSDQCGWEAPNRWATGFAWQCDHLFAKLIVTDIGMPLVNLEGAGDADVESLSDRCRFDWTNMKWLDEKFTKTLKLERGYE